ncbi:MAG: DUF2892 domain-containing protein [Boseongicola sp.]|nr:DUF2892 domain-containing protein [Boseongicola sp.]NNJ66848.1 DUF2892 domain-containing protein [Boseongicola sp.]
MLSKNMGNFDRAARVIIGLALLIAFFALPDLGLRWVLLIGIVPLATGLLGSCPAYSIFGVSTCSTK